MRKQEIGNEEEKTKIKSSR